jgi:hypothetical protein
MLLRIVRPLPKELEGLPLGHLAFQGCYDLRAPLADLLLAAGYAIPEDTANTEDSASPHRQPHR